MHKLCEKCVRFESSWLGLTLSGVRLSSGDPSLLLLVLLLLYDYGSSFGSAMTTIDAYLIVISIPHCIPSITLY